MLISQTRGSATSYYLPDAQGSIRALTDTTGNVTDRYDYDAFGNLQNRQGTTVSPYRYTGQQFDAVTGLYDLRARYYDPAGGRFLSRDTFDTAQGDLAQLDRYLYAGQNPINRVDPSGQNSATEYTLLAMKTGAIVGGSIAFGCSSAFYLLAATGQCGPQLQAQVRAGGIGGAAVNIFANTVEGAASGVAGAAALVYGGPAAAATLGGAGILGGAAQILDAQPKAQTQGACSTLERSMGLVDIVTGIAGITTIPPTGGSSFAFAFTGFSGGGGAQVVGIDVATLAAIIGGVTSAWNPGQGNFYNFGGGNNPVDVHTRADQLGQQLPAGSQNRVTVGVGDTTDDQGNVHRFVTSSEKDRLITARIPQSALLPGEEVVPPQGGTGHAEDNIVKYVQHKGWKLGDVGASRPICLPCEQTIRAAGGNPVGPLKGKP